MAKRPASTNQDYFKVAGGETGRRSYASEKAKLKKANQSARTASAPKSPKEAGQGVAATGAGSSTASRGKKRQAAKSKKQKEDEGRGETVARMVEAQVPSASPARMLPPARASTELGDFLRITRGDYDTLRRASKDFVDSLLDLGRTPLRLFHLLRTTARAGA